MREFKCGKCENTDIAVQHRPAGEVHTGFKSSKYLDERLICSCKQCGFAWKESPSDSKDKK